MRTDGRRMVYQGSSSGRPGNGAPVALVLALVWLTACTSHRAVLQIYDSDRGDSEVVQALVTFAQERGLEVDKPVVAPVKASGVVVLYGREWMGYSAAMDLIALLDEMGISGRAVEGRLQNHVVTRGHIAVFLGSDREGTIPDSENSEEVRELLCSRDQGDAVVLQFANYDLEIETYVWVGETVAGKNYYGNWSVRDGVVLLALDAQSLLEFEPSNTCLATPPAPSEPCDGTMRWLEGDAVPVLVGCDLRVREAAILFGDAK